MVPRYFDIHSHLNAPRFENDLDAVIGRLKETQTHTIVVGTGLADSKKAVELAEKHEEIYASVGLHPVDDPEEAFDRAEYEKLARHPRVVAIGECGLDFFHAEKAADFERQKKLFLAQVELATDLDKPLMIHSRNAYDELLEILEPLKNEHGPRLRGNIHFFAGSAEIAKRFFALDFTISFTGVITFTHDYDETVRAAPLDKILSETDSPFVAPVPHRGQRNEPIRVQEVAKRIAEIRGEDEEVVRAALVNNALFMLG